MFLKMSDEKQSTTEPTVIITPSQVSEGKPKSRLTKKHVLVAVVSLVIAGLVLTAVLVGIRLYTDHDLEILKYTLQANGISQNVSVDNNVVIIHVQKDGADTWILQDFDREIQVAKVLNEGKASCYVTVLNRSVAIDAASVPDTAPTMNDHSPSQGVRYQIVPQRIADISYLGKKASSLCQNIPTYHATPDCGQVTANTTGLATTNDQRSKRQTYYYMPCTWNNAYCPGTTIPTTCYAGCCYLICGTFNTIPGCFRYVANGQWVCSCYYRTLCSNTIINLRPTCNVKVRQLPSGTTSVAYCP